MGLVFGMAMTAWLRFMYNNPMAEITLTVLTAYATYVVGDQLLGVSGVLAVVILGAQPWVDAEVHVGMVGYAHRLRRLCGLRAPDGFVRRAGGCRSGW